MEPQETLQQPHALRQVMVMETLAVLVKQLTAVQDSGALQGGSGSSGGDQRGSTPGRGTEIDSNMEDSMVILLRVKEGIHHLRARAWPDAEWRRRNGKRKVWSSSRINKILIPAERCR